MWLLELLNLGKCSLERFENVLIVFFTNSRNSLLLLIAYNNSFLLAEIHSNFLIAADLSEFSGDWAVVSAPPVTVKQPMKKCLEKKKTVTMTTKSTSTIITTTVDERESLIFTKEEKREDSKSVLWYRVEIKWPAPFSKVMQREMQLDSAHSLCKVQQVRFLSFSLLSSYIRLFWRR